jgi:hypothetical protein
MPARSPLDDLVEAMEKASGAKATVSDRGDYIRVSVAVPADPGAYRAVLDVLSGAASWGSSDGTGKLRLWGAVLKRDQSCTRAGGEAANAEEG